MDTDKAIAIEAKHPGTAWDYLFFKKQPPYPVKTPTGNKTELKTQYTGQFWGLDWFVNISN
jgi:hypothetical protein